MKKKLTIDEQIEDLKKKGVTFEIMCEEDAKKFLRYNNYYFKLKTSLDKGTQRKTTENELPSLTQCTA